MAKAKLTKCEIRWDASAVPPHWYWRTNRFGGWRKLWGFEGDKRQFVRDVVEAVLMWINEQKIPGVSLLIYKRNGQIQEERTYPRSADPKRSKG